MIDAGYLIFRLLVQRGREAVKYYWCREVVVYYWHK